MSTAARSRPGKGLRIIVGIGVSLIILALAYEGIHSLLPTRKITDFTATTLDGKPWALAEHRGKHPLVLNFFATWCGPCKLEYPHLVELQKKYASQGVEVVLLTDEPAEVLKEYPDLTSGPFTYLPNAKSISQSFGVESIPHTFIFNREGKLAQEIQGFGEGSLDGIEKHLK